MGGASFASGKTRIYSSDEGEFSNALSGKTIITGLDLTIRFTIDSYRYISLQTEYLYRKTDGYVYTSSEHGHEEHEEHEHHGHSIPEADVSEILKKQSGFYTQFIYRFDKLWRFGIRLDSILKNSVEKANVKETLPENLYRWSIMLDYSPTEFSRIRAQYNINCHKYIENKREKYNSFVLQLQFAIGAHGAHSF